MGWESLVRAMLKASVYMIPRTAIIFVIHKVLLVHELQISCARFMKNVVLKEKVQIFEKKSY